MVSADTLPYDILLDVLSYLPVNALCSAALVNTTFNEAATPLLYRTIRVRDRDLQLLSTLTSRPALASYVHRLTLVGSLTRTNVVELFPNVRALTIEHDRSTFEILRRPLPDALCELSINAKALRHAEDVTWLDRLISRMRSLSFSAPPQALIARMGSWLFSSQLLELRLADATSLQYDYFRTVLNQMPSLRILHLVRTLDPSVVGLLDVVPNLKDLGLTLRPHSNFKLSSFGFHLKSLESLAVYTRASDELSDAEPELRCVMQALSSSGVALRRIALHASPGISGRLPDTMAKELPLMTIERLTSDFILPLGLVSHTPRLVILATPISSTNLLHGAPPTLRKIIVLGKYAARYTSADVSSLALICPGLRTVVSSRRTWTVNRVSCGENEPIRLNVQLERS